MGWSRAEIRAAGRVSDHGSEQDRQDQADWDEFVHRVKMIAREHRYSTLGIEVEDWS